MRAVAVVALATLAASLPVCLSMPRAHADTATTDRAFAEGLFQEGRKLMSEGHYAEACAKFGESQRMAPALGTLLNLATCHERQGRLATAWAEFGRVIAEAHRVGDTSRETFAANHEALLRPRVSYVELTSVSAPTSLVIAIDGVEMGSSAVGTPLPVDPGPHDIDASAPGKQAWKTRVEVNGEGTMLDVAIPPLVDETPPPVASASAASPAPIATVAPSASVTASASTSSQTVPPLAPHTEPPVTAATTAADTRPAAYTFLAIGAAGLIAGGYFGLHAISQMHDANVDCPQKSCDPAGATLISHAKTSATWSTVSVGVGLTSIVLGGALLLGSSASSEAAPTRAHVELRPVVGLSTVGLMLTGAL